MPYAKRIPKLKVSHKDHRAARPPPGSYSAAKARAETTGADFPVGGKAVFLPNIVVSLLYNPRVPPTHAQFRVPLRFNKLDLRDYLWHTYSLRVSSIRSNIIQQPIRYVERNSAKDIPGKKIYYQPQAIKKMIVRLDRPFTWPADVPEEDMSAEMKENKRSYALEKDRKTIQTDQVMRDQNLRVERNVRMLSLARRADALMQQRMEWGGDGVEYKKPLGWKQKERTETDAEEARGEQRHKDRNTAAESLPEQEQEPQRQRPLSHAERVRARAMFLQQNGLKPLSSKGGATRHRALTL